jgi:hypothetical protein
MKLELTLTKMLLRELKNGFSHRTIFELEKICALYLKQGDSKDKLFYYALRGICFELKEHLDANQPIETTTHNKIELSILDPLNNAINSFEDCSLINRIEAFNQLLIALGNAKQIKTKQF